MTHRICRKLKHADNVSCGFQRQKLIEMYTMEETCRGDRWFYEALVCSDPGQLLVVATIAFMLQLYVMCFSCIIIVEVKGLEVLPVHGRAKLRRTVEQEDGLKCRTSTSAPDFFMC